MASTALYLRYLLYPELRDTDPELILVKQHLIQMNLAHNQHTQQVAFITANYKRLSRSARTMRRSQLQDLVLQQRKKYAIRVIGVQRRIYFLDYTSFGTEILGFGNCFFIS